MAAEHKFESRNLNLKGGTSQKSFTKYLAAKFKCVDFLSLLAQSLVHAAQVVAHHAELVFVAPLSCSQLILNDRNHRYNMGREEVGLEAL